MEVKIRAYAEQSYTDTGWIEIDIKVAEETGVCKFKYV